MLVENVNHASIHNVVVVLNQHGLVLEGTNLTVDGAFSGGHGITSLLLSPMRPSLAESSLEYNHPAPFRSWKYQGYLDCRNECSRLRHQRFQHTNCQSLCWGVTVRGTISSASAANLDFSDISIDYPGRKSNER